MNTSTGLRASDADATEWTVVPRGKRRTPKILPKPPGVDKDLTLHKLKTDYEHRLRIWQASTCRRQIRRILDQQQPEGGWQIKYAVCLASGSFCRDNWECQRRTMTQFAAFMDIVEHLQTSNGDRITAIAQELVYTPLDVELLSHLNVTAYHDPAIGQPGYQGPSAKDYIGCNSFVFEPFMDKILSPVRQLLTSDLQLLIGTSAPEMGAKNTSPDEHSAMRALYDQFNAGYSSYYFPTFEEDPNVFEGLRISWKVLNDENDND